MMSSSSGAGQAGNTNTNINNSHDYNNNKNNNPITEDAHSSTKNPNLTMTDPHCWHPDTNANLNNGGAGIGASIGADSSGGVNGNANINANANANVGIPENETVAVHVQRQDPNDTSTTSTSTGFMGGLSSGSGGGGGGGAAAALASNQRYSDPGIIHNTTDPNHNNTSITTNDNDTHTHTHAHGGITISAEQIKKELEQGEIDDTATSTSTSQNALSSFISKIQLQNQKSNIAYNAAMEKQIIDLHKDNERRLRGYPPLRDGAIAAATAVATGNKHAVTVSSDSTSRSTSISTSSSTENVQSSQPSDQTLTSSSTPTQTPSQTTPTINPEPCTGGKFLITKLRSWRTGYERILSFHETYFTTLDPDTKEITNLWYYSQIKQYMALLKLKEEDCLSIDIAAVPSAPSSPTRKGVGVAVSVGVGVGGGSTKLKFKCLPQNRNDVMTSLAKCKYLNDRRMMGVGEGGPNTKKQMSMMKEMQSQNPVFECQRQTRHNRRVHTLLVCAPHGLIEVDAQTATKTLQTYLYKHMRAICFISDESSGVVFYVGAYGSVPINSVTALGGGVSGGVGVGGSNSGGGNNSSSSSSSVDSSKDSETICDEKVFFVSSNSARRGGSGRSDLVTVLKHKFEMLGLPLEFTESVTLHALIDRKLQRGNISLVGESLGSFRVRKYTLRHYDNAGENNNMSQILRNLVITRKGFLMEYEEAAIDVKNSFHSAVVNCRKLRDIVCLVRHPSNNQESSKENSFTVEFKGGICRTYSSSDCDKILVSILDATVNLCRNFNATVTDTLSVGYTFSSLENNDDTMTTKPSDAGIFQADPIEVQCLKRLQSIASNTNSYLHITVSSEGINEDTNPFDESFAVIETCREFNVNVSLGKIRNLPQDENLIVDTIHDLWAITSHLMTYERHFIIRHRKGNNTQVNTDQSEQQMSSALCAILQTLYRLMMTPLGYCNTIGDKDAMNVFATKVSQTQNKFTLYWTLKCASALLLPRPFAATREKENERANKSEVMRHIPNLATFLVGCEGEDSSPKQTSDLILMVVSNILESVLCAHKETTTPKDFSLLVNTLAQRHDALICLLESPSAVLVQNAALFMHILSISSPKTFSLVRESALNTGILLQHFYNALFSPLEGQRFLSRYLCSLWISGPPDCSAKKLLRRIVPAGFLPYLAMPTLSEAEEEQLDEIGKGNSKQHSLELFDCVMSNGAGTNITRLRKSVNVISDSSGQAKKENFRIFFHVLEGDHSLPDLIWNTQTREELKHTLESELRSIRDRADSSTFDTIAWNHQQFTVLYPSLKNEVQVGTVYMRLWLQTGHSFIKNWHDPLRLFELLFRRLLCDLDHNTAVTNMCIQCLERLYVIHASKIGIFPDIIILVRSMVKTRCSETQHRLLGLILTLIGGSTDASENEIDNVAGNAEQLINNECISYLCQFAAWGHLYCDDDSKTLKEPLQNSPAVWFIAPPGKRPPLPESIKGPFRVNELKILATKAELLPHSLVATTLQNDDSITISDKLCRNAQKWIVLEDVWQLRWQLFSHLLPSGIHPPSRIALMAIKCLSCMVGVHKSVDSRGVPFFPIPLTKRLICGECNDENSLSEVRETSNLQKCPLFIICQELLCTDSHLAEASVDLITEIMDHNEKACAKLWETGIFFFALAYTGPNYLPIAQLIERTLMGQNQTILHKMLPEGLLNVLANHGAEKFVDVFLGRYDTPEVIWSVEMRENLIKMIEEHLGDFPKRLHEHTTEKYQFCPIPKISYELLENETYCRNYYLNNLCDEAKFPDWPIAEPVELFQACLKRWEEITLQRQEIDENTLENASKLIGLTADYDEIELRVAYRKLAQKYYHCESSNDTEMLHKIDKAYDSLMIENMKDREALKDSLSKSCPVEEDDVKGLDISCSEIQTIHLLMKTQLIICKRYPDELGEYKYPSYQLLLSCLNFPSITETNLNREDIIDSCLLRENRWNFVRTTVDLIFNTCLVSPLNAEELIRENGVTFLASILNFYIQTLSLVESDLSENESIRYSAITEIIIHIVHTISGIVYFESGRSAILMLKDPHRFCLNWRRCIDLKFLQQNLLGCNMLKRYALEGLASMTKNEELQNILLGCHITWPLLSSMLVYDPSLEISPNVNEKFETTISQAEMNFQAFLATRALGMLCGMMTDELSTRVNGIACNAMKKMLTQPLARMLSNNQNSELLETLNLSVENPLRLWDESMREELATFVNKMVLTYQNKEFQDVKSALEVCNNFEYSNLSNEVNIGGVYIHIFNKMDIREAIRNLPDSSHFARSLLQFVGRSIQKSTQSTDKNNSDDDLNVTMEEENHWFSISDNRFIMAVRSILHLVQLDGVVDDVICEREGIQVLLSLLDLPLHNEASSLGHDIFLLMSPKKTFADSIGNFGAALRELLSILEFHKTSTSTEEDTSQSQQQKWLILESLTSSSPLVSNTLVASSAWLELLGIIVGYSKFTKHLVGRQGAAKILSRLLWDPSSSSVAGSLLQRFLPLAMLNIFKDKGPDYMLEVFDSDCETPELIWNSLLRDELRAAITDQLDHVVSSDDFRHSLKNFSLDAMFSVKYKQLDDRLFIGGVYVEHFLKDPTFQVRDPNGFLEMLLAQWSKSLELIVNNEGGVNEVQQHSNSTIIPDHDVLETVTSACTTLCERPHLSMKLAPWGYMKRAITFIHRLVAKKLLGSPLMCTIKLLNVGAVERVNVEAIIHSCDSDGKNGIVDGIMKCVGSVELHPDIAYLLETLKNIIRDALGDVEKCDMVSNNDIIVDASAIAKICDIAPSPAPGTEPVQKMKKLDGGDPLSMLLGTEDPLPVPTSKSSARTVKAVRSQKNATSRSRTNIHKPVNSQTTIPKNNLMKHINTSAAQGAATSQNSAQPLRSTQSNYKSNLQKKQASRTHNNNVTNPNPVPNTNNKMTQNFTQYKHALPNNHRAVRPIRNKSTTVTRARKEIEDPLQINNTLHFQAQGSHPSSSFQNNGSSTYGQHGIVSERNQIGFTPRDQWNTRGSHDNVPQLRTPTQYSNPNAAVQNYAIQPSPQHGGVANSALSASSQVNHDATNFVTQNVQQSNISSHQYQHTQSPMIATAGTGSQFPTQTQYSNSKVPIQKNLAQRRLQDSNGLANSAPLSSQVNRHPMNFVPPQNVQSNNTSSHQYQQTQSPMVTPAGTGLPQPNVIPRSFQEQMHGSHLSQYSGQIPGPNMTSYTNEVQTAKTAIVQQGTDQSNLNTTSNDIHTNSSIEHDPMIIAQQKIASSSGAPGSARGRNILLSSVLKCGLIQFLVDSVLENSASESLLQRDLLKANAVEIIQLLLMDPGYGLMFQLILDKSPNWKNHQGYKVNV